MRFRSLAATGLALLAGGASAQATLVNSGIIESIEAGYYCDVPPDDVGDAISGAETVDIYNNPYDFIQLTDRVPSLRNIGIGLVVQLNQYTEGESLTAEARYGNPEQTDVWATYPDAGGLFWLGYNGGTEPYGPLGIWEFTVKRNGKPILVYEFEIVPGGKATSPCG